MADISTYLEQIKEAVYGEDVRQAIHDAIYQCYTDGSAGAIDLTARESIESLESEIQEILESGTTAEAVQAKVASVIQEMIDDGTLASLEVETDNTLSVSGAAADAAATGEAIAEVKELAENAQIEDGSITKEQLSNELCEELGLDANHHLTEVELEMEQCGYATWDDSGTWVKTPLFRMPQYIRIETHYGDLGVTSQDQYYSYYSCRYANVDDPDDEDFVSEGGTEKAKYSINYEVNLKNRISDLLMGDDGSEAVRLIDFPYHISDGDHDYIQLRFSTTSSLWRKTAGISVYAIYDDYTVDYDTPDDSESEPFYLEDLPRRYAFQGEYSNTDTVYPTLYCAVPYYPDFTYYVRGGNYVNTEIKRLDCWGVFDDDVFDTYWSGWNATSASNYKDDNDGNIPLKMYLGNTAFVDGYSYSDQWAYITTPSEDILNGPKWLMIPIYSNYVKGNVTSWPVQTYADSVLTVPTDGELEACFDTLCKLADAAYVTRFDNMKPRGLLDAIKYVNPNYYDANTLYNALLAATACPLAGANWLLFGDSLTDNYGGDDESSDYFAGKIAREFGMQIYNYAASGGNINIGEAYTGGVTLLEQYISDYENGNVPYPDYITVAYGSNGFKSNIGTIDNTSEDTGTCFGATKYFIERINEVFPNAVLGFVLPPRSSWAEEDGCTAPNADKDIDATREAIREVIELEEYGGIPYIDMSKESGITYAMLPDCIHISSDEAQNKYYHAMRRFMMGL